MSKGQTKKTREAAGNRRKLTRAEKKQIAEAIQKAKGDGKARTAQQTIPYLTFLVVNMADTKRKLENDIFAAAGIAQKYNCRLTRLDYQQEAGLISSVPIGENLIPIQRGLTTSSTAIFIPFITQELFQTGQALYYGLNALSNNMILCDRKQLKNPNGLILGTPGSGKSFAAKSIAPSPATRRYTSV